MNLYILGDNLNDNEAIRALSDRLPQLLPKMSLFYVSDTSRLPSPLVNTIDTLLGLSVGKEFTIRNHPHASLIFLCDSRRRLRGALLFKAAELVSLASSQSRKNIGTLLYSLFAAHCYHRTITFESKLMASLFYEKMGAINFSKKQFCHLINADAFNHLLRRIDKKFRIGSAPYIEQPIAYPLLQNSSSSVHLIFTKEVVDGKREKKCSLLSLELNKNEVTHELKKSDKRQSATMT